MDGNTIIKSEGRNGANSVEEREYDHGGIERTGIGISIGYRYRYMAARTSQSLSDAEGKVFETDSCAGPGL
jgi:hypothetical protein